MTICLASTILPDCANGVGTFNRHFIDLFTAQGHKIVFMYVDVKNNSSDDIEFINPNYIKVTIRQGYHKNFHRLKSYFRPGGSNAPQCIAVGLAMREWLIENHKKFNIDITEVSDGCGYGIFLTDKDLPPLVLTGHGSNLQMCRYDYVNFDEHGKVINELEKLSYQNADAIITHSPLNKIDLEVFTDNNIYVLPIAFKSCSNSEKTEEKKYAVSVGQLRYLKGPELLCHALKQNPETIVHWIGAYDNFDFRRNKTVIDCLQSDFPQVFGKNFLCIKPKNAADINREMQAASFVIIPSIWETFSYVAIEAAALGKPIIITNSTGASGLFKHMESAIIVEPDASQLQQAIKQLQTNEILRKKIGSNAQKMINETFIPSSIVQQRIDVYQRIIAQRKIHKTTFEQNIDFIKKYLTPIRKFYFTTRTKLKKLLKK